MKKISAVIIVFNEEKHISECIESMKDAADEIVIMDGFSTDRTVDVCRNYTTKIFQQKFKGFGRQKQDAIAKASHEWILQIDADERLSPGLVDEIQQWKSVNRYAFAGYSLPFHFYFMGKRLRFGGCWPEYHVRLFNKAQAAYGSKEIHEGISVTGRIGTMHNPVLHYSYDTLAEYFEKCNTYTSLIAEEKYNKGKRFRVWHLLRFPGEFILRYFIKLGFLDGIPGLVYAVISSYYALMKHVKLIDVERQAQRETA